MSQSNPDQSNVQPLPGRECRCQGDGATWSDTSACPVHTVETSPLSQAVTEVYKQGRIAAFEQRIAWLESGLRAIIGPADSGPHIWAYREAGGGYEGLQAIARFTLEGVMPAEESHAE